MYCIIIDFALGVQGDLRSVLQVIADPPVLPRIPASVAGRVHGEFPSMMFLRRNTILGVRANRVGSPFAPTFAGVSQSIPETVTVR
jgi:hypothetical protein